MVQKCNLEVFLCFVLLWNLVGSEKITRHRKIGNGTDHNRSSMGPELISNGNDKLNGKEQSEKPLNGTIDIKEIWSNNKQSKENERVNRGASIHRELSRKANKNIRKAATEVKSPNKKRGDGMKKNPHHKSNPGKLKKKKKKPGKFSDDKKILLGLSNGGNAAKKRYELSRKEAVRTTLKRHRPPHRMIETYKKYSSRSTGEIVRSIDPLRAGSDLYPSLSKMLLYNISCIDSMENIRSAQLHLNRKRLFHHRRRALATPLRVRSFLVQDHNGQVRAKPLAALPVPHNVKQGWYIVDLTTIAKEMTLGGKDSMLGIRFEAPKGKIMSPGQFLTESHDNSSSYFVVLTESSHEDEDPVSRKGSTDLSSNRSGMMEALLRVATKSAMKAAREKQTNKETDYSLKKIRDRKETVNRLRGEKEK